MGIKEDAVSPVIGVLLMLTLTLIIAALVNSYAGGLMSTETKAPSVTLQISYSQTGGMEIRHVSGDPIPTQAVKILVRPSDTFGKDAALIFSMVNKQYITSPDGESWTDTYSSLKPGDVCYITNTSPTYNLSYLQADIGEEKYRPYWFNQTKNQGNTFIMEIYYKNTIISRNEVLIEG